MSGLIKLILGFSEAPKGGPHMLGKLSIIGALAATLMIPAGLSAQPYGGPLVPSPAARGVVVERGGPIIGRRYHGGIWYASDASGAADGTRMA